MRRAIVSTASALIAAASATASAERQLVDDAFAAPSEPEQEARPRAERRRIAKADAKLRRKLEKIAKQQRGFK